MERPEFSSCTKADPFGCLLYHWTSRIIKQWLFVALLMPVVWEHQACFFVRYAEAKISYYPFLCLCIMYSSISRPVTHKQAAWKQQDHVCVIEIFLNLFTYKCETNADVTSCVFQNNDIREVVDLVCNEKNHGVKEYIDDKFLFAYLYLDG